MKRLLSSHENPASLGAVIALGIALCSLLYVASLHFGPWRQDPIQADEFYFTACAARGVATGQIPIAGCHDNKAPMILAVHEMVQLASSAYDLVAMKVAAYFTILLVIGGVAWVALRLAGGVASIAAGAFAIQVLVTNPSFLALKTETVGAFFVLSSLVALLRSGPRRLPMLLISGGLMGLAVVTKQTYAFAAVAAMVWFFVTQRNGHGLGLTASLVEALTFGVGVMLPFCLCLLIFFVRNQHVEFLASFFVYPTVYGSTNTAPFPKSMIWALRPVLPTLSTMFLPGLLFAIMATTTVRNTFSRDATVRKASQPYLLIVLVALSMLLVPLVSPLFFPSHIIPFAIVMSILGGAAIADLGIGIKSSSFDGKNYLTLALTLSSAFLAISTWYGAADNHVDARKVSRDEIVEGDHGGFAYVFGMSPDFYVYNGFVAASNVMYPEGLPHTPKSYFYEPPKPDTLKKDALDWVHEQSLNALFSDFERTPPRYIMVMHYMARSADSKLPTDVPEFNEYLEKRCAFVRQFVSPSATPGDHTSSLFRCEARS